MAWLGPSGATLRIIRPSQCGNVQGFVRRGFTIGSHPRRTSYRTAVGRLFWSVQNVLVDFASPSVIKTPPLPPCPRCHRLTGVEEDEQSGSSLRWFVCRLC